MPFSAFSCFVSTKKAEKGTKVLFFCVKMQLSVHKMQFAFPNVKYTFEVRYKYAEQAGP